MTQMVVLYNNNRSFASALAGLGVQKPIQNARTNCQSFAKKKCDLIQKKGQEVKLVVRTKRIIHMLTLGVLLISLYVGQISCAQPSIRKSNVATEHWVYHPSIVLALSRAILDGMRRLIDELLISEIWYKDMDISVMSNNAELLRVRVTDLVLQKRSTGRLFTRWNVYLVVDEKLEHLNTITLDNNKDFTSDSLRLEFSPDSLFLDVYSSTSQLSVERGRVSTMMDLIYWRDISKKDKVVKLRVPIDPLTLLNRE